MWDCTFRKTIAWNTTILDWFSPIKNIYLRNCFIKTVHTHLSYLHAWLILQLPQRSLSGDADPASATRDSVLREPRRATGRRRCSRIQNEDRTLTKKQPREQLMESTDSFLTIRPHHEAVEKGRPISSVLGTANSCTVIGPASSALRPALTALEKAAAIRTGSIERETAWGTARPDARERNGTPSLRRRSCRRRLSVHADSRPVYRRR